MYHNGALVHAWKYTTLTHNILKFIIIIIITCILIMTIISIFIIPFFLITGNNYNNSALLYLNYDTDVSFSFLFFVLTLSTLKRKTLLCFWHKDVVQLTIFTRMTGNEDDDMAMTQCLFLERQTICDVIAGKKLVRVDWEASENAMERL